MTAPPRPIRSGLLYLQEAGRGGGAADSKLFDNVDIECAGPEHRSFPIGHR